MQLCCSCSCSWRWGEVSLGGLATSGIRCCDRRLCSATPISTELDPEGALVLLVWVKVSMILRKRRIDPVAREHDALGFR
jgi:hypothetical protein